MKPSNALSTDFFNLIKNATPHLALFTSTPNAADTSGTEVTGGSYARQPITFGTPNLTTGEMKNTNTINFASMPTSNVTHFAIRSSLTAGNLLAFGSIAGIATLTGDEIVVNVGNLLITFAGN